MHLDYPTIEWVRDYLRDHPGSTAPQIAEAWYPAEVQEDRIAWQMAKDKVRRRIQRLIQWGMAERVNDLAGRSQHATYRTKEVDY
jgi:hypothetical protein